MSAGGRGFVARGGYQRNGRGRGWNGARKPVAMQRNIAAEVTVKAVETPVTTARSTTPFAASSVKELAQSSSTTTPTCMYCGQRGRLMMGSAERLANEARTIAGVRGWVQK